MRIVVQIVAIVFWFAAVGLFVYAFTLPSGYPLSAASAPQVTQVYSQSTYYAVLAIAAGVIGLFLMVGVRQGE